ncbi:MAG: universal stress protein [Gammaproteobacteria bacterium]|nr:MAG: universal stress protein [Gammaproteobacteria bacterium]
MIAHYKLIIVPVDGSEGSVRAAAFAADLAAASDCPVQLLHVFAPSGNEIVGMAQLPKERIEEISRESGKVAFARAREAITAKDVKVEESVVWGEPREEIVAAAEVSDGLIVMGRRGLGKVKELLLGSVSDAVLRTAKRPIVLVS